jgi:hypothetical protein
MARQKVPPGQKSWTDWNVARANLSGRRDMMFISELCCGYTEVMRMLKNGPYISLHDLDDVGIEADSFRLFVESEGAIEVNGGGTSGEALSQAAWRCHKRHNEKHHRLPGPLLEPEPDNDEAVGKSAQQPIQTRLQTERFMAGNRGETRIHAPRIGVATPNLVRHDECLCDFCQGVDLGFPYFLRQSRMRLGPSRPRASLL